MKRETPATWATSPVNRRHIVDVDEIGNVSRCGRWRPESRDVVDRGGVACESCAAMTSLDMFQRADRRWKDRKRANNAERNQRIIECVGRDMPAPEIARLFGVSVALVHTVAYRHRRGVRG